MSPTTDTQQRFHTLCLKIKKELYEQDPAHNIGFQLSISELFEIAKFLDVKEDDWETFCRVQLLHNDTMMPWVAALVASVQRKDIVIDTLTDRMLWMEQEISSLRTQMNQLSKRTNKISLHKNSPIRRQVPRLSRHRSTKSSSSQEVS